MKILLADDHLMVAEALGSYLTQLRPGIEMLRGTSFGEALKLVSGTASIDLVILDLHMPGMDGTSGLRKMCAAFPDIPVVIISGNADGRQMRDALDSGAAGFIPKNLSGKAMLSALELILAGEPYIPEAALSASNMSAVDDQRVGLTTDSPLNDLTAREFEVLVQLVRGLANKEIARALGSSDVTVAFHLKNVYRKLDVSRRTQAVRKALGWGLQI
ncbi:MAG: response regulator transcription factor [Alphaproteobacteria bacterium]|nr:response regulator transcription factor [Alphaproteobacteria bacterium]